MDSEYWDSLLVFFVIYGPALTGALAFCLIGIATWQRPPKILRSISGALGAIILLAGAWTFVFRPILFG